MILKHTYIAAASALLMTSLMGAPSFAAGGSCETDPNWTCLELPENLELPDPHVRAPKEGGHIGVLRKSGEIARPTKMVAPARPKDGSPKIQSLPKE